MKKVDFLSLPPPSSDSPVVVGIDPGEVSAVSIVTVDFQPKLLHFGTCSIRDLLDRPTALAVITSKLTVDLLVIEDQYVSINKRSAIVLSRHSGCWQLAAAMGGLPATFVNPTTWHKHELGGAISKRSKSKQIKLTAIDKCWALWRKNMNEHEADASLMARYVAMELFHGRQKEKIGRGTKPYRTS